MLFNVSLIGNLAAIVTQTDMGSGIFQMANRYIPNYGNAEKSNLPFFRNRGDGGTVHLNRFRNSVMSPTGKFCCKIPDTAGVNQTLCAILSKAPK